MQILSVGKIWLDEWMLGNFGIGEMALNWKQGSNGYKYLEAHFQDLYGRFWRWQKWYG
jgi:hypothetical protein